MTKKCWFGFFCALKVDNKVKQFANNYYLTCVNMTTVRKRESFRKPEKTNQ